MKTKNLLISINISIFVLSLLLYYFKIIILSNFYIIISYYSILSILALPFILFFIPKQMLVRIILSFSYVITLSILTYIYNFFNIFIPWGPQTPDLLVYHKVINHNSALCVLGYVDYFGTPQTYPVIAEKLLPGIFIRAQVIDKKDVFWNFEKDSSEISYNGISINFPNPVELNRKYSKIKGLN